MKRIQKLKQLLASCLTLQPTAQESINDQLLALAVRQGCDRCEAEKNVNCVLNMKVAIETLLGKYTVSE